MALKLAQRRVEARGGKKVFCDVRAIGTSMLVAFGIAVFLYCFVYVDMQMFYHTLKTSVVTKTGLGENLMVRHEPEFEATVSSGAINDIDELSDEDPPSLTTTFNEASSKVEEAANPEKMQEFETLTSEKTRDLRITSERLSEEEKTITVATIFTGTVDEDSTSTLADENAENQSNGDTALETNPEDDGITSNSDINLVQPGKINHTTGLNHLPVTLAKPCDLSQGYWVYDNVSHPLYRTKNCPFADPGFRCQENGRPDTDFMNYRWQPHGCNLPRFNATEILERLRGKRMVFVGDSLGRNNWESMLCMLAEGVPDKRRIYEVNGQPISKHQGKLVFKFEDYNARVEYYRDPFLIPQGRPPRNAPKNVKCSLKVDQISYSAGQWKNADIVIFNAGHWWTEQKIFRANCRFQEDDSLKNYTIQDAFKIAMRTWGKWMDKNIDPKKTEVFVLSFASVHFRGGTWNRGGHCHEEVRPLTEEEARAEWQVPWINKYLEDEFQNTIKRKDVVNYLDITTATNYRSDGHGALYTHDTKKFGLKPRNRQDCSHFCLPGVPDTWNELILATLLAKGKGDWGQPIR